MVNRLAELLDKYHYSEPGALQLILSVAATLVIWFVWGLCLRKGFSVYTLSEMTTISLAINGMMILWVVAHALKALNYVIFGNNED